LTSRSRRLACSPTPAGKVPTHLPASGWGARENQRRKFVGPLTGLLKGSSRAEALSPPGCPRILQRSPEAGWPVAAVPREPSQRPSTGSSRLARCHHPPSRSTRSRRRSGRQSRPPRCADRRAATATRSPAAGQPDSVGEARVLVRRVLPWRVGASGNFQTPASSTRATDFAWVGDCRAGSMSAGLSSRLVRRSSWRSCRPQRPCS
jgi:hypothetical protein